MTRKEAIQLKASSTNKLTTQNKKKSGWSKNSKFKFSKVLIYLTLLFGLFLNEANATCPNGSNIVDSITPPNPSIITYYLGASGTNTPKGTEITIPAFQMYDESSNRCLNFEAYHDYRPDYVPVWLDAVNINSKQLYIYTEDTALTDTDHTIRVTRYLPSQAERTTTSTWELTIQIRRAEQCQYEDNQLRTLSMPTRVTTTYLLGIAPVTIPLTPVIQRNNYNKPCFFNTIFSLIGGKPSSVTIDIDNSSVSWQTSITITASDISLHGTTSNVQFRVTPTSGNYFDNYYFDVAWVDPCASTSLSPFSSKSIGYLTMTDGATPQTRTLTDPGDTVSNQYSRANMCGDKTYSIVPKSSAQNAVTQFVTVTESSGTITLRYAPSTTASGSNHHGNFEAYLRIGLANYPGIAVHDLILNFQVYAASCDCNKQPWAGTVSAINVAVAVTDPGYLTIPAPPQDHNYSNKAHPALRNCTPTSCSNLNGVFSNLQYNGAAANNLSWVTWSSNANGVIQLWPTNGALKASNPYVISGTWTPSVGVAQTYNIYSITITCQVTHFTVGNTPSAQTYSLYQKSKVINLTTVTYTQVPACSYTYTQDFSFPSGLDSQITESTSIDPALEVYSVDRTSFQAGTFTVVMQNNIEFTANQGQTITTFSSISQVPRVNIQITTSNSCTSDNVGGTDSVPTFSQSSISVDDGTTGSVEVTYSMDTFETSLSSSFNLLCGQESLPRETTQTMLFWELGLQQHPMLPPQTRPSSQLTPLNTANSSQVQQPSQQRWLLP